MHSSYKASLRRLRDYTIGGGLLPDFYSSPVFLLWFKHHPCCTFRHMCIPYRTGHCDHDISAQHTIIKVLIIAGIQWNPDFSVFYICITNV